MYVYTLEKLQYSVQNTTPPQQKTLIDRMFKINRLLIFLFNFITTLTAAWSPVLLKLLLLPDYYQY